MNKKFSTLVAAFAILGASASAQTLPSISAEADSIAVGEYYYLANSAGDKYLSIAKTSTSNKDSLVLATTANKTALWTVAKGATVALGDYFTFTNVSTGKTLKLDAKGNAIISSAATGIDKFGWNWTKGTASALTNIAGGKTYTLVASATDSLSLSEGATTTVSIKPMLPAWRKMTATELNEINGNSFKWTVAGTTSTTDQATKSAKAFNEFALKAIPTSDATVMYLEKVGSVNATTKKGAYLNVDTVYYTRTGALIDSTLTSGGLIFALDTLTNASVTPVVKAGKRVESFQFEVWTNAKDSIVLAVKNIPNIGTTGNSFANNVSTAATPGYVSLVGFDGTTKALTASKASSANVLPSVSFGAGTKVELAAGAYYIYKQTGDSAYVATLNTTIAGSQIITAKAGSEKAWMPSTQWAVATKSNKPVFTNREANNAFTSATPYLYASTTANVYYYGNDTLKIVPVATEGIYVGYKKMGKTAAEEKVTKLALQFHSALTEGTTPYVFKSTGDSIMKVANLDKSGALFFNVLPVDTFAIGSDSLKVVSYKLFNGKDTLAYDAIRSAYVLSSSDKDQAFIFRETTTKGWYQVLPIASAAAAWTLNGQVSVSGTSAEVVLNSDLNKINGYFSLEAPLEPEYATIENAPAHKRIASVENPTLAISMNSDSCAVLKAVTELKSAAFEKQNFSMYLDVYDTDTVKPLYLITTQQTLVMDSASYANDVRYFMFAAGGGAIADSLGFKKAMRIGVDRDSLHVYNVVAAKDTVKPANMKPYTFAFMKSDVDGEYYIENQEAGEYMAQKNGVLHLVANTDNALLFTVNTVVKEDLPTSNDQVSAEAVKVIAGEGQVTIAGAAGKKVVISNILGQVVANTVISSDNAAIAAPAGVVVVAVEGEDAVKAIVK